MSGNRVGRTNELRMNSHDFTAPDYLTGTDRELFGMIVDELFRTGGRLLPSDALLIEGLVIMITRVRQSRKEGRHSGEEPAVYAEIHDGAWEEAVSMARDLGLSQEALKSIVWEQ